MGCNPGERYRHRELQGQADKGVCREPGRRRERAAKDELELRERLYSQIGQLKVELDWLKKKSGLAHMKSGVG